MGTDTFFLLFNKRKKVSVPIYSIYLLLLLSAGPSEAMPAFMERAYSVQKIACQKGFNKEYVKAGIFKLATYQRFGEPSENIRIYIEGDGRAWETKRRLSNDPTPSSPIALELAIIDTSGSVVYIARPGQFPAPDAAVCDPTYWSARRFSPEVVEAFDEAINILKEKAGAKNVELVGYSGGAALAVLIAARRSDVVALRTIAGNLDPKALCAYHKVDQLDGSMDPLDAAREIAHIPQRHFIGSNDKIVPSSIAESFVKKEGNADYESITIAYGATHNYGWLERWPSLLSFPLSSPNKSK